MWHNIWKNSGRPGSGMILKIKCSCEILYISAIKDAFSDAEKEHNDGNVFPQNFTKTF